MAPERAHSPSRQGSAGDLAPTRVKTDAQAQPGRPLDGIASERLREQIDGLVGPATPHFAYQLRARIKELVLDLPDEHPLHRYAEQKMEYLDRLGHASSRAEEGPHVPENRPGWEEIPSSAPASRPLPRRT